MRVYLAGFIAAIQCCALHAQFSDSFSDGNLDQDPEWHYTAGNFEVLNQRLHSTNANGGAVIYDIWTQNRMPGEGVWSFDVELQANPSGSNYIDVFLACDTQPLHTANGYFLRIGDTRDRFCLFKMLNGKITEMISGPDGELNKSLNIYRVSVYFKDSGDWQFHYSSPGNTRGYWTSRYKDTFIDGLEFTGIKLVQNGTGIIGKHFFDNLYCGSRYRDTIPPEMHSALVISPLEILVQFNEPMSNISPGDFLLNSTLTPDAALPDSIHTEQVVLKFSDPLSVNRKYTLSNSGSSDTTGNQSANHSIQFFYLKKDTAAEGELIITEIMCKPAAGISGLPEAEYIEIKNIGPRYISLKNCIFSDGSSSVLLPDSLIGPFEYRVITKKSNASWPVPLHILVQTGTFPALNNSGDKLTLKNQKNECISSVEYSENQHRDALKKEGGWSLELIDTLYACIATGNWSSNISGGGTPGFQNSVCNRLKSIPDPKILRTYLPDPYTVRLFLNVNPDSNRLSTANFICAETHSEPGAIASVNRFDHSVDLQFSTPFAKNRRYTLMVRELTFCTGGTIQNASIPFASAIADLKKADFLINEILFNPLNEDPDFIEIYNPTDSFLDVKSLIIARMENGIPAEITRALPGGYCLFPHSYAAFTADPQSLINRYPVHDKSAICAVSGMPVLPNERGHVALLDMNGNILDEFIYDENMHAPVIADPEGISLEKTRPDLPSLHAHSWTSAAETAGFGTPGMQNSQYTNKTGTGNFELIKNTFSPDNDGYEDLALIQYVLNKPGYVLNTHVFSETGVWIASPHRSLLLSADGLISWDGRTENGIADPGNYVILLEGYEPGGSTFHCKFTLSLLSR